MKSRSSLGGPQVSINFQRFGGGISGVNSIKSPHAAHQIPCIGTTDQLDNRRAAPELVLVEFGNCLFNTLKDRLLVC